MSKKIEVPADELIDALQFKIGKQVVDIEVMAITIGKHEVREAEHLVEIEQLKAEVETMKQGKLSPEEQDGSEG